MVKSGMVKEAVAMGAVVVVPMALVLGLIKHILEHIVVMPFQ